MKKRNYLVTLQFVPSLVSNNSFINFQKLSYSYLWPIPETQRARQGYTLDGTSVYHLTLFRAVSESNRAWEGVDHTSAKNIAEIACQMDVEIKFCNQEEKCKSLMPIKH